MSSITGVTSSGSPGPLERKIPSGFMLSTSAGAVFHGTTVTLQPLALRERMILSLMPQSTATTLYFAFAVREYQRLRQLTRETASCGTGVPAMMRSASSFGVSGEVMITRREPRSRMLRVRRRVSMPAIPGI